MNPPALQIQPQTKSQNVPQKKEKKNPNPMRATQAKPEQKQKSKQNRTTFEQLTKSDPAPKKERKKRNKIKTE